MSVGGPLREPPGGTGRHRELPAGFSDLLPEAAAPFFALRRTLLDTLDRWGYRPVVPPGLEYVEVLARPLDDPAAEAALCRIVDRATGHTLALRSDFTPQVARIVGARFREASLPLRLCYEGAVVRDAPAQRGRSREIHQVGAELLGVLDPEADAEAIALLIGCLAEAGVCDFKVDVGQVEFFKGILQGASLAAEDGAALTSCVARKDVSELERLLARLPLRDRTKALLAELPLLAGGVDVLDRASELVETEHSRRALENLAAVVGYVDRHGLAAHLTIDLGELRGIDYHTGVMFEAFVPQWGAPLCRGGRYDGLLGLYGPDLPATGFSLDLLAVTEALRLQGGVRRPAPRGVFIVNYAADRSQALELARALRGRGIPAARDMIRRSLEDSLAHARAQGFGWTAVLGVEGLAGDAVRLVHLASGRQEDLPARGLPARIAEE